MNTNIDNLTLGQIKQIQALLGGATNTPTPSHSSLDGMVGKKVIIRTDRAGVWFGTLEQKAGNEVIITNARRMWKWHTKQGISLSECATLGINQEKSRICEAVDSVWLEAIEIIPCTDEGIKSIEGAVNAEAE